MREQKIDFSNKLRDKLIEKMVKIRKSNWKRPQMRWEIDNYGEIVKVRLK
jgi:hypothetical protein